MNDTQHLARDTAIALGLCPPAGPTPRRSAPPPAERTLPQSHTRLAGPPAHRLASSLARLVFRLLRALAVPARD
jgi:hypothetical protein